MELRDLKHRDWKHNRFCIITEEVVMENEIGITAKYGGIEVFFTSNWA